MSEPKRPLKVFLCHAHADRDAVRTLYTRLTKDGVDAWLDKEKLLPGQDWELEIKKAVREADVVVVCLSKRFNQAGFRQKEVRLALDTAMEKPEGEIFIIPARLEECDNLENLKKWHEVNLFEEDGYNMLVRALRKRADMLGVVVKIRKSEPSKVNISWLSKRPNLPQFPNEKKTDYSALGILITAIIFITVGIFLATQLKPILEFLNYFGGWQNFLLFLIIWLSVDIFWTEKSMPLFRRIGKLFIKPWISKLDNEPFDPPVYPRRYLEQLFISSQYNRNSKENLNNSWLKIQRERVFDFKNPLRPIGYFIALVFFSFFVISDMIVITNTLGFMGIISSDMPKFLEGSEFAMLIGAVFVGLWMLVEMAGTGNLIDVGELSEVQKEIYKKFALIEIFFSVIVIFALAIQRSINLGLLHYEPATELFVSFILYGILAIINSFSAALTVVPATTGLLVLLFFLLDIFPIFVFLIDIVWRVVYIAVDIVLWVTLTPVFAIPYWINRVIVAFTKISERD